MNYTGTWTVMSHGKGVGGSSWAQRYADTDGFLPKPPQQIGLINNPEILSQNKGWYDGTSWSMSGTPVY